MTVLVCILLAFGAKKLYLKKKKSAFYSSQINSYYLSWSLQLCYYDTTMDVLNVTNMNYTLFNILSNNIFNFLKIFCFITICIYLHNGQNKLLLSQFMNNSSSLLPSYAMYCL